MGDWLASEDISVLWELLQTPKPTTARVLRPGLVWSHDTPHKIIDEKDSDSETKEAADDKLENKDEGDRGLVVIALKRQVQLLQQEYDRHLEQNVARSVVKAGGKTAPRAATIKLYRNCKRLARVAHALVIENQRLVELLQARQRDQEYGLQSEQNPQVRGPCGVVSSGR